MKNIPCFLFHEDCVKGRIFYDAPSRNKALAEGWVTGPHLIKDKIIPVPPKDDPAPLPTPAKKKPAPNPKKPRGPNKGKK